MDRFTLAFRYGLLWVLLAAATLGLSGWLASLLGWPGYLLGAVVGIVCAVLFWHSLGKDPRVVSR